MRELILGAGNKVARPFEFEGYQGPFENRVTLDIDPNSKPDVLFDLTSGPLPFEDNSFDTITATEVLEHIGQQGDYKTFFAQFEDYWRVLKPGGFLCASCPMWDGLWAFGDPGHTRIINQGSLVFLSQKSYEKQVGKTAMTDYRWCYKGDFEVVFCHSADVQFFFALKAIKA